MLLSRPYYAYLFCLPCPFVINNNRILLFVCLAIDDHEMSVNRIPSFTYLVLSPEALTFLHHIEWFDMIVCIVCNHHIQQHTHPRGTWSFLSLPLLHALAHCLCHCLWSPTPSIFLPSSFPPPHTTLPPYCLLLFSPSLTLSFTFPLRRFFFCPLSIRPHSHASVTWSSSSSSTLHLSDSHSPFCLFILLVTHPPSIVSLIPLTSFHTLYLAPQQQQLRVPLFHLFLLALCS